VKKLREERQRMDRELMERERRTSFKANIDSKAGRVAFNEGKNSNSVGSGAGADALVDPVMRIRLERERQEKELMERERRESQKREGNSPFAAAKAFATATATAANGAKSPVRAHGGTRTNNNAGDDVDSVRRIRMERERQEKELMERERRAADDRDRRQGAAAASNSIHSQPASSSRVAAALVNARRQSFERQQQQQQQEQTPVRERSSSFASAMAAAKAASESNQQQPAQQSAPVINQAYSAVHPAPAEAAAVIVEESPIVDVKIPVRKLASEDENGAEEESSDMWSDEGNKPAAGTNTANDPNYYRIEQSDVDNNQSVVNVNAVDLTKEQRQQQPLTETDIIVEEPQRQQQPLTETNIIVEESIIVDQQQSTAQQQIQSLCATALYDYDAAEANEMTLRTGDFIANIQQLDEAWWYGSVVAGDSVQRSGLFPANYVELIIMTATDADAAANKLPVEELVAEVEHQQHPMQVIEEQPQQQAPPEPQLYEQEPQQLLSVETAAIGEDSLITVRVLYDYEAADGSELTIRSGEIIFNVQQVSADWWR
jgi:hypothetical protein